jgi:HD-GYP domain-containing protein (c-di-GMP phosphodiesterase class II)
MPLAARIFTVVDVWDALAKDPPYREAWSREKVMEYLLDQSGKHFDPKVVEVFLQLRGEGKI